MTSLPQIDQKLDPRKQMALFHLYGLRTDGITEERRIYKNAWSRAKRRKNPEHRRRRAAQFSQWRSRPGNADHCRDLCRKWHAKNRKKASETHKKYYAEFLRNLCQLCGQPADRCGKGGICKSRIIVLDTKGRAVVRVAKLCRHCRKNVRKAA